MPASDRHHHCFPLPSSSSVSRQPLSLVADTDSCSHATTGRHCFSQLLTKGPRRHHGARRTSPMPSSFFLSARYAPRKPHPRLPAITSHIDHLASTTTSTTMQSCCSTRVATVTASSASPFSPSTAASIAACTTLLPFFFPALATACVLPVTHPLDFLPLLPLQRPRLPAPESHHRCLPVIHNRDFSSLRSSSYRCLPASVPSNRSSDFSHTSLPSSLGTEKPPTQHTPQLPTPQPRADLLQRSTLASSKPQQQILPTHRCLPASAAAPQPQRQRPHPCNIIAPPPF
ncbi:hypothetical protein BHE74_00046885 [Ensete ventricosum]|nr:hypothetical protein BHE74_00046885 [Ensete ventricosum]